MELVVIADHIPGRVTMERNVPQMNVPPSKKFCLTDPANNVRLIRDLKAMGMSAVQMIVTKLQSF